MNKKSKKIWLMACLAWAIFFLMLALLVFLGFQGNTEDLTLERPADLDENAWIILEQQLNQKKRGEVRKEWKVPEKYNPKDNEKLAVKYLKDVKGIKMTFDFIYYSPETDKEWVALMEEAVCYYYPKTSWRFNDGKT